MGLSHSIQPPTHSGVLLYAKLKTWNWNHISDIQNNYSDEIYGFGLTRDIVMKLTKLNEKEVEELFCLLESPDSEVINAMTMFITFYVLGNCESFHRTIERIFDLFDFYNSGELNVNEMTLLMFCISRSVSSVLYQSETCPTDTAMYYLVLLLLDMSEKKGQKALTRQEFIDAIILLVNKVHPKTLEAVYFNHLQSRDDSPGPESNFDDYSLTSAPPAPQTTPSFSSFDPPPPAQSSLPPRSTHPQEQQQQQQQQQPYLDEPFKITGVPDKIYEDQSNTVLSLLDVDDIFPESSNGNNNNNNHNNNNNKLKNENDKSSHPKETSPKSISLQSNSSLEPTNTPSILNPVMNLIPSSRPSSASSLREKPLTVLPPIAPIVHPSPREKTIQETHPSQNLSPKDPVPESAMESSSQPLVNNPLPSSNITERSDDNSVKEERDLESLTSQPQSTKDSARSLSSRNKQQEVVNKEEQSELLPSNASLPPPASSSVIEYCQQITESQSHSQSQRNSSKDPLLDNNISGFIEISQISLTRLTTPNRSGLYPYVELKLVTTLSSSSSSTSSSILWCHRTELSLDSDNEALWYTHFRSPLSLLDTQQHHLVLEVYYMEKVSPRLGSVDDVTLQDKRVLVGQALLSDCGNIFKKQLKWIQLIGILNSNESGVTSPQGMYTVTARFNPNAESSPRPLLPSHTPAASISVTAPASASSPPVPAPADVKKESHNEETGTQRSEVAGEGAIAEGGVVAGEGEVNDAQPLDSDVPVENPTYGTEEGWPTEYEYSSYYHEGGYYDNYTHAYLGNAYDEATGQYYHDENLLYDPQQDYHHQDHQHHDQAIEPTYDSTQYEEQTAPDMREISPDELYLPPVQASSSPSHSQVLNPSNENDMNRNEEVVGGQDEHSNDNNNQEQDSYSIDLHTPLISPVIHSAENPPLGSKTEGQLKKSSSKRDSSKKSEKSGESESLPAPLLSASSKLESVTGSKLSQEEVGFFEIQNISVSKLKKADVFFTSGRMDPFVTLSTGSGDPPLWSYTTDVQIDKSSLAEWIINSSIDIPVDLLGQQQLTIVVKDHKAKNKVIGQAVISLRTLPSKGSNWSSYEGMLTEKEKVCGEYSVRMRYKYKTVKKKTTL